jgi:hypothetical protein
MRTQSPADILIGTAAERAGEQISASVGTMFFLEVAPFTLSVFDGAGGRQDYQIGSGALVLPADQIAIGTGVGTGSTPNATFDVATSLLTLRDPTGVSLFVVNGLAATRLASIVDETGVPVFSVSGLAAAREVRLTDSINTPIVVADTKAGARRIDVLDELGVLVLQMLTLAAGRTFSLLDDTGKPIEVATLTAARTIAWQDATSANLLELNTVALTATLGLLAGAPRLVYDRVSNTLRAFDAGGNTVWELSIATGVLSQPAISPPAMGVIENNYALATAGFVRLTANPAGTLLTSIVKSPGADGAQIQLVNVSPFPLTVNYDAGGTAAYRILTRTGANVVLGQDGTMKIVYDSITGRWREV